MRIDSTDNPTRVAVIEEARRWLGTPFRHQAALQGVGCDCAGLVRGVGKNVGVLDIEAGAWRRYANYTRAPNPRRMDRAMREFLHCVLPIGGDARRPDSLHMGDILWLAWRRDLPMHLGLVSVHAGRPMLIHGLESIGRVVEHGLTEEWLQRATSVWRYPGLVES